MVRQTPVAVARPGKRFARGEVQANAGANKIVRRSSGRDGARALSSARLAIQAPLRFLPAKLLSCSDAIVHHCTMSFAAQSTVQPANLQQRPTFRSAENRSASSSQLPLGSNPTGSCSDNSPTLSRDQALGPQSRRAHARVREVWEDSRAVARLRRRKICRGAMNGASAGTKRATFWLMVVAC